MVTDATSQVQVHGVHIVLFAVWFVIFAGVYLRARLTGSGPTASPVAGGHRSRALGWTVAIAVCSVVAAATHLAVIREHFAESALYGMFFVLLTVQQIAFAAWVLWRPTPALLRAGGLAALAVVLLWLATRTTGIPLGPAAGEVEPFGTLDVIASTAELALALLCVPAWRALEPAGPVRRRLNVTGGRTVSVSD